MYNLTTEMSYTLSSKMYHQIFKIIQYFNLRQNGNIKNYNIFMGR